MLAFITPVAFVCRFQGALSLAELVVGLSGTYFRPVPDFTSLGQPALPRLPEASPLNGAVAKATPPALTPLDEFSAVLQCLQSLHRPRRLY